MLIADPVCPIRSKTLIATTADLELYISSSLFSKQYARERRRSCTSDGVLMISSLA